MDEPSSLPDGTEVELVPVEELEHLDANARAKLFGFLAESVRNHVPGAGVSAEEVIARVRAKH